MDIAWDLSKHPDLEEVIAEVDDVKISVAAFKTIHYPISAEEQVIMDRCLQTRTFQPGWLNDEVTIIYIFIYLFIYLFIHLFICVIIYCQYFVRSSATLV